MTTSNLMQKVFMNKKGQIALIEKPNLALITWVVIMALTFIVPSGQIKDIISVVAFGALFTWAWLEIFHGVNYFRRSLGLLVLILTVLSHSKH